jgi:glycosyltransferase involved in cell wall biosynthesis
VPEKVAIVTDWIYGGGSERVVEAIHRLYPDAPIYTSYCSPAWRRRLSGKVVTGYLQWTPWRQLRKFLPLLRQNWFAGLNLSSFDLVISVTGNGEAKFAQALNGRHVCYCNTPVHFYWSKHEEYLANPGFRPRWLARLGLKLLIGPLRRRDYAAAQRVDQFIANSTHIRRDIKKFYDRNSVVIHPPVDVNRFASRAGRQRAGFVVAGRQTPYKRFDIAVAACSQLSLPLTVIGDGPDNKRLRRLAGRSVKFVTNASDQELVRLFQSARALLFPQVEDFGITAVEAMAAGTPVIAYRAGGALDYVIESKTGLFFDEPTPDSLMNTLRRFDGAKFNPAVISRHAAQFAEANFRRRLQGFIESLDLR